MSEDKAQPQFTELINNYLQNMSGGIKKAIEGEQGLSGKLAVDHLLGSAMTITGWMQLGMSPEMAKKTVVVAVEGIRDIARNRADLAWLRQFLPRKRTLAWLKLELDKYQYL